MDMPSLLKACGSLACNAGTAVMQIYDSGDFEVELKSDNSPLTSADKRSNKIIEAGLKSISDFPVLSEEGLHDVGNSRTFWLVDPLDGTKEFIKRNGEFAINIGLIKNNEPVLGVVYAPAKKILYFGAAETGAFKQLDDQKTVRIVAEYQDSLPTIATSRTHLSSAAEAFAGRLGEHRTIYAGSSLKFCLVAEGAATVYPRFVPCWLWDTAAGDAIVRAAGGTVTDLGGKSLRYDPGHLQSPNFIVSVKGKNYQYIVRDMVDSV